MLSPRYSTLTVWLPPFVGVNFQYTIGFVIGIIVSLLPNVTLTLPVASLGNKILMLTVSSTLTSSFWIIKEAFIFDTLNSLVKEALL